MHLLKTHIIFISALLFSSSSEIKCAKILGIFPMVGRSHFMLSSTLMRGLAEAGNDITFISPYEDNKLVKNGSYRSILLDGFAENYNNDMKKLNLFEMSDFDTFSQEAIFQQYMYEKSELLLKVPSVQKLIKSKEIFDAVIIEHFSNDALKIFAHIFKAHLIVFNSVGPYNFVNRLVGNPTIVSYNPQLVSTFLTPMSFRDRIYNTLLFTYEEIMNYFVFLPRQDSFVKQYFPGVPNVRDILTNVSLLLLNSHESLWQSVPLVPNAIPIGGYHIKPPKKLPKDLQEYLNEKKNGVIYFSLGTNLKFSDMEKAKQQIFLNVFKKLKEDILWKLDEDIPNLPKNVKTAKWLPQMDILAHRNVKLFISHGGLLSMTETVANGVPILTIPVFGDQANNGNYATRAGYGLSILYHDPEFCEDKLMQALTDLLTNPKYKSNAVKQSRLYYDRPMSPMDTFIYWVEYVIKHGGATHLRVDGIHLPWYQYLLIDVIAFLLFVFFNVLLLLVFVIKAILTIGRGKDVKIKPE